MDNRLLDCVLNKGLFKAVQCL